VILSTIVQYLVARIDVARARFTGKLPGGVGLASPDRLPPLEIPSFALGEAQDRTLGEIDQDGFLFARDPRDAPFFNRRTQKVPRHHRPLLVVLRDKVVCVEKGPPYKWQAGVGHRILRAIGWEFYLEAAALLRLQGLPFIPCLFGIDTLRRVIRLEFIWGETLYHSIGHGTLDCDEVQRIFAALVQDSRCATAAEIVCMLEQMAERVSLNSMSTPPISSRDGIRKPCIWWTSTSLIWRRALG